MSNKHIESDAVNRAAHVGRYARRVPEYVPLEIESPQWQMACDIDKHGWSEKCPLAILTLQMTLN